ncbi:MAG: arginine--tRNA ligase [Chloroflexi bacterium]|nr:MAG: arginine--tRNA ligase [Chloroflexota bacterium]
MRARDQGLSHDLSRRQEPNAPGHARNAPLIAALPKSPSSIIDQSVRHAVSSIASWPAEAKDLPAVLVERTQNPTHGDYSVTLPLKLARTLRRPPMTIANELAAAMALPPTFGRTTVAAPGFINVMLEAAWLQAQLASIVDAGDRWGSGEIGRGVKVQVEFVSANPTGPLLFSHARGAVVGDVTARILAASGFEVQREYYVNDQGKQIRLLGESIRARLLDQPVPEGGYSGDYIAEIANEATARAISPEPDRLSEFGVEWVQRRIQDDLARLDVRHDQLFLESSLYAGWDAETMAKLSSLGRVAQHDGATWFKSDSGKDEVIIKRDGYPTYFWSDILYHRDKFEKRGFDRVVDVWGADHQGQVGRVREALAVLGIDPNRLAVLLVQLVSVKRGEETVRMSRRAGVGISLKEMLDEVGPDAVRYFFLLRSADAQMEFDVELARRQSSENPVYYAQYAHARLANVLTFGAGVSAGPALARLDSEWELELMRVMLRWPDVVREAAEAREPHRLAFFTDELAAAIHRFYKNCRVVTDDAQLTAARLLLSRAARTTIANALGLMGVAAPDRM